MKKFLLNRVSCVICLCMGVSFVHFTTQAWGQFAQVQPWVPPEEEISVPEDYKTYLMEAMRIHSTQYQLNNILMTTHPNALLAQKQADMRKAQLDALNACNAKRLQGIYQNPEEAWKKMTDEYDRQERELKVYINASSPAAPEGEADMAFPHWRLGRDVLTDVYAHPEKYGSLVSQNGLTGFKHWKDQDYIYIEKVNHFLEDVVRLLGVSKIPGVSRDNSFAQNESAYQSFIEGVKQRDPKKYALLKKDMLSFPKPEAPLPPVNEIVQLTTESSEGKLFPQLPEPWQEYIKNPRLKRLPEGEMNAFYQPNSLKLRMDVGNRTLDNRFSVYQQQKEAVSVSQEMLRVQKEADQYLVDVVKNELTSLGIDSDVNLDDLESLKTTLVSRKRAAIEKARELLKALTTYESHNISDNLKKFGALSVQEKLKALDGIDRESPEYSQALALLNASQEAQDEVYLDALEKDIDGTTMMVQGNAKDVEMLMKSAESQKALTQAIYKEQENEIMQKSAVKIDADCMNGGL